MGDNFAEMAKKLAQKSKEANDKEANKASTGISLFKKLPSFNIFSNSPSKKTSPKNEDNKQSSPTNPITGLGKKVVNNIMGIGGEINKQYNNTVVKVQSVIDPKTVSMNIYVEWAQNQSFWTLRVTPVPSLFENDKDFCALFLGEKVAADNFEDIEMDEDDDFNIQIKHEEVKDQYYQKTKYIADTKTIEFSTNNSTLIEKSLACLRLLANKHKVAAPKFSYKLLFDFSQEISGSFTDNQEFKNPVVLNRFINELRTIQKWKIDLTQSLDKNICPFIKDDPLRQIWWNSLVETLLDDFKTNEKMDLNFNDIEDYEVELFFKVYEHLMQAYQQLIQLKNVGKLYDPTFVESNGRTDDDFVNKVSNAIYDWKKCPSWIMFSNKVSNEYEMKKFEESLGNSKPKAVDKIEFDEKTNKINDDLTRLKLSIANAISQYSNNNRFRPWHWVSTSRFYTVEKLHRLLEQDDLDFNTLYKAVVSAIAEAEYAHESHYLGKHHLTQSRLAVYLRRACKSVMPFTSLSNAGDLDSDFDPYNINMDQNIAIEPNDNFADDIHVEKQRLKNAINWNKIMKLTKQLCEKTKPEWAKLARSDDSYPRAQSISARVSHAISDLSDSMRRVLRVSR